MSPAAQAFVALAVLVMLFAGITWRHVEATRAYERGEL